jgi:hypothetical protein
MIKMKQFWALFRFQTTVNPFIWFMPIAFGLPLMFQSNFLLLYSPNLSSLLPVQNLFFVGFFTAMILAPEKFQFGSTSNAWNSGTEFLLTRAIDRPLLYRSKVFFLYIIILLAPLANVLHSSKNPDLKVTEYSNEARQQCLKSVPGSILESNPNGSRSPLISIPRGNVLIEKWHFWLFLISALGGQALILLLYPFKRAIWIFYAIVMSSVFLPFFDFHHLRDETPTLLQRVFFPFAAHQWAFWILTVLAVMLGQLWAERRYARLEQ